MEYGWKCATLRQVAGLLREALGPTAQLRLEEATSRAGESDGPPAPPLIRLRRGEGAPITLALLPWDVAAEQGSRSHVPLRVLRRASRRVHEELRRGDENFVDTAGAVRLHLPGLLIDRNDLEPPPLTEMPQVRNPFSDRNSLVPRTLVASRGRRPMTIGEVAGHAGVSLASASYVVRALELAGLALVTRTPRGREVRLSSPMRLVEQWVRRYDWTMNAATTLAAPVGAPERFLARLGRVLGAGRWALTMHAGAALRAPHAAWDHVHCYVDPDDMEGVMARAARAGWEPDAGGKLTLLRPHYRQSVWSGVRTLRGRPVVSDLQLVLDLWHYPVRGREQALHLMEASASLRDSSHPTT